MDQAVEWDEIGLIFMAHLSWLAMGLPKGMSQSCALQNGMFPL
jgi:hypothetical protein